jgi:ABC-type uncharacterized transport system substrate-binding protein
MHRRDVMSWIGGAMAAGTLSFAACAQQATPVIGYLNGLSAADRPALTESFRKGLAEAGYTADRVTIEYRYGNYRIEQLRVHAAGRHRCNRRQQPRSGRQIGHTNDSDPVHQRR